MHIKEEELQRLILDHTTALARHAIMLKVISDGGGDTNHLMAIVNNIVQSPECQDRILGQGLDVTKGQYKVSELILPAGM